MNFVFEGGLRKPPVLLALAKKVSLFHRWLGIALCVMIALWFATGSVLSFVPFPSLSERDRVAGSETIDTGKISIDLATGAFDADSTFIEHLRLVSVNGVPRILLFRKNLPVLSMRTDNGQLCAPITGAEALKIAERFSGQKAFEVSGPFEYDQWVVHNAYDALRPFYKIALGDPAGTELYVSARAGQVVQRTNRVERGWNYVGAVTHWINPTFLRKNYPAWHAVVWVLALGGLLLTIAGILLGLVRYINLKRLDRPGLSPFSGLQRLHHTLGLFIFVILLNWTLSGWLMMASAGFFTSDQPGVDRLERLRGLSLASVTRKFPGGLLGQIQNAKELEFSAIGGRPLLLVRGNEGSRVEMLDPQGHLQSSDVVPDADIQAAVEIAWAPKKSTVIRRIGEYDSYNLRVNPLPREARRVELDDPDQTWVQMDAASGQLISVLDANRRLRRWVVDGIHTLDFPGLNRMGQTWHVLLLAATSIGFAFSCTGIAMAIKRMRRLIA